MKPRLEYRYMYIKPTAVCFQNMQLIYATCMIVCFYGSFSEGVGGGFTVGLYGTGGSYGGEAGCPNQQTEAPPAYGSFVKPIHFGSGGGRGINGSINYRGTY